MRIPKFLNRFTKRKNNVEETKEPVQNNLPFEVSFHTTQAGDLQVDLLDKNADFKQSYNSTRLISLGTVNLDGEYVKNCLVSWYNEVDAEYYDSVDSRRCYQNVLVDIDLRRLQQDPNYCYIVMTKLLEKNRVEKYLNRGLEEQPIEPCGNYIGGLKWKEEGYWGEKFSPRVGRAAHYSKFMNKKRLEHKQDQEYWKQHRIREKQEKIKKLKQEIEEELR